MSTGSQGFQKALFYGVIRSCSVPARTAYAIENTREFLLPTASDCIGIEPAQLPESKSLSHIACTLGTRACSVTLSNPTTWRLRLSSSRREDPVRLPMTRGPHISFFMVSVFLSAGEQPRVNVRYGAHTGLKSDIAPCPRCANMRH